MAADHQYLPDDIICNIVARLPTKPLQRFRLVSKYWNRTLMEPSFMKLRSRKNIILPLLRDDAFTLIDDMVIVDRLRPFNIGPFKLIVIGTFNGVVLLSWIEYLILYNPFTHAYKTLPRPPFRHYRDAHGFAYGDDHDLKIVRFRQSFDTCQVFSFREGSWSTLSMSKYNIDIEFEYAIGHFVNGFLYWIAYNRSVLIALDAKDMVLSEICPPFKITRGFRLNLLGTMDGCLCSLKPITNISFDIWVMKEQNQWSKIYSFNWLPLNTKNIPYYAICILDGRRLLMWNPNSENLMIYDMSKGSYKTLNISVAHIDIKGLQAAEYVETLVSPSDILTFGRKKRRNNRKKNRCVTEL